MDAWNGEPERTKVSRAEKRAKLRAALFGHDLCRAKIQGDSFGFGQAVGVVALDDLGKQGSKPRVICTENRQPVEWHLVDKLQKALVDPFHAAVGIQMFSVEIRHCYDGRRQAQERSIAL